MREIGEIDKSEFNSTINRLLLQSKIDGMPVDVLSCMESLFSENPTHENEEFILDALIDNNIIYIYNNSFSDLIFLTSLLNLKYVSIIRDKKYIYEYILYSAFRNRNYVNEINSVFLSDCIFNYFVRLWNFKINESNKSSVEIFYLHKLKKDDTFYTDFQRSIDYFAIKHQVNIPKDLMDGFYKNTGRHYQKIINLLV